MVLSEQTRQFLSLAPGSAQEERTCPVHGKYIARLFRVTATGPWLGGECPTCAKEKEAEETSRKAAQTERQRQARIESMIQRSGIPTRFKDRTIENYQATDPGEQHAKEVSAWFADTWPERLAAGTSMIFVGFPGTGKTHLATAIGNQLLRQGVSVLFATVSDAMRQIKSTYDKDASMSEAHAIEIYTSPRLLILDEVHVQTGSDHERRLMFEIVNRRYENVLPSIIMSNLAFEKLQEFLGDRIVDRLREGGGKLVKFTWKSRRA